MRTTALKLPISPLDNRSGRCADSNQRGQAQRFLAVHGQVHNLFRVGRHLMRVHHYRLFRARSYSIS